MGRRQEVDKANAKLGKGVLLLLSGDNLRLLRRDAGVVLISAVVVVGGPETRATTTPPDTRQQFYGAC